LGSGPAPHPRRPPRHRRPARQAPGLVTKVYRAYQ
jgi:hypothetical protein